MAGHAGIFPACLAILFGASTLGGCAIRGPVLSDAAIELRDTPFHPQTRHHCGPAALATVLGASGLDVSPDSLASRVYLPGRRGSLQLEMHAAPRELGRVPLVLPRHLESIVAELEAGRPVLVLHDYGWWRWRRWHYAVVVGYDPRQDEFVLRSGRERRQTMRTRHFMVYWHHAGRWAMVVLRPGETAANGDARLYLESAAAFEKRARPEDARAAFDAAVSRWPAEPVAWIGRGTAQYALGHLPEAARDYQRAVTLAPELAAARNNLAQVMLELGCPRRARAEIARIDVASLAPAVRDAVLATSRAIEASASDEPPSCAAMP